MANLIDTRQAAVSDLPANHVDVNAHVVDQLIAERGQKLATSRFWPLIKPVLYRILHYDNAVEMANEISSLPGMDALEYVSRILHLDIKVAGQENIPREGSFILAANHPTGIADGIAVYDALSPARKDIAIFTNRDALRVSQQLSDVLIPVEWREAYRSHSKAKETLRLTSRAFRDKCAVVLFPSGRIAFWKDGKLNERPWQPSIVSLALKYQVPVLPVHVGARNSWLFYLFSNWSMELRDVTVFHELLNKRGKTFSLQFGKLIPPSHLTGDIAETTQRLQDYCFSTLANDGSAPFPYDEKCSKAA